MRVEVGGYDLEFFDCFEICQGGPEACSLIVDGWLLEGQKFDPSPLLFEGKILLPMRKIGFFKSGYVLTLINSGVSEIRVKSKDYGYMRLISIDNRDVTFATTAWGDNTATYTIA